MLVIVNLSSKGAPFPTESLAQVDAVLATLGLRKQVRSILVPGQEFTVTYDGPKVEKKKIEDLVSPLAGRNHFSFSVEVEESVSFP